MTEADATGGLGSFFPELRGILTEGLRAATRAEVIKRYGPGAFSELPTVAADGSVRPAGAPTPPAAAEDQIAAKLRELLSNPFVLVAVAIVGAVVIARLVRA